jgi:hypothetical protein
LVNQVNAYALKMIVRVQILVGIMKNILLIMTNITTVGE